MRVCSCAQGSTIITRRFHHHHHQPAYYRWVSGCVMFANGATSVNPTNNTSIRCVMNSVTDGATRLLPFSPSPGCSGGPPWRPFKSRGLTVRDRYSQLQQQQLAERTVRSSYASIATTPQRYVMRAIYAYASNTNWKRPANCRALCAPGSSFAYLIKHQTVIA